MESLSCYHQGSRPDVQLVASLPADGNQADYRNLPCFANSSDQLVAFDTWPSTPVERSLWRIAWASIIGDECIVLPRECYLLEPLWHHSILASHPAYSYRLYQRGARDLHGSFFLIPLYWFANYYHWNAQVLPRLHEVISRLPHDCRLIIPESAQPWQVASLTMLGINEALIFRKPARQRWTVENLYYATPCAHSGGHSAASVCWLRNAMVSISSAGDERCTRKLICITRGESRRRILNEEIYLPKIRSLGFTILDPAQLSYEGQIKAFAGATAICAPHGAGLVNMLWARAGCQVIEIFSPATIDRGCFWDLAQNLGHQYSCFLGQSTESFDMNGDSDYQFNPEALLEFIYTRLKA